MNEELQLQHITMVEKIVPKALITCKLPYISQPVSIHIEASRLSTVLAELLSQDDIVVYEKITIPQVIDHEIVMVDYSHKDVLNEAFKIPTWVET